jgi:thiol reductant ABC exporter CydC subunit
VELRVLGRVRARVYEWAEPLAPARRQAYRHGDLLTRLVADVDALQGLHVRVVFPALAAIVVGGTAVGVASAFLPLAGLVLAAGLLAGGVAVPTLAGMPGTRGGRRRGRARGELTSELVGLLEAAPELAACGGGASALARAREADRSLVRAARRDAWVGGLADAVGVAVAGTTVAGVLAVSAHAAERGSLDPVVIAMLGLLALASFEAVQPLPAAARELSATLASSRRLLDLGERDGAVADPVHPEPPPSRPFAITLDDVHVRYGSAECPALDGVTLALEPGRRVALVGPSGAGKTTIVSLLLRFLDPERGRVLLAGRDVRDHRQEDVRRLIAVASQESHLCSATLADNLRVARPDADDADVERALRRSQLWEWVIGLPEGVDTLVGEDGRRLSGGQRQRVVLARALLSDAPVLVLDEPTAHLDPQTAEALLPDTFAEAEGRTVLLITHRPEGLEHVDEIVRLSAGRATDRRVLP